MIQQLVNAHELPTTIKIGSCKTALPNDDVADLQSKLGVLGLNKFINQIRKYVWIKSLLYIIFGLFFLFEPDATLDIFIITLASFVAAFGVINIIGYLWQRNRIDDPGFGLPVGILQLIIAAIIMILAKPLLAFLPIVLGITLMVLGITRIVQSIRNRQFVNVSPIPFIIYGVLLAVVGAILAFNPYITILVVLRLFGGTMVVMAIMEMVMAWEWRK